MKKAISLLVIFVMSISLCSCSTIKKETPESIYAGTTPENIYAGTYVCDHISWVPLQPITQRYDYDELINVAPNTQMTIFLEKDGTGRAICQVIKSDVAGIVKVGTIYYDEINFTWYVEDGKIITNSQTRFLLNTLTGAKKNGEQFEADTKTYIIDGENFYPDGYKNCYYRKQSK